MLAFCREKKEPFGYISNQLLALLSIGCNVWLSYDWLLFCVTLPFLVILLMTKNPAGVISLFYSRLYQTTTQKR